MFLLGNMLMVVCVFGYGSHECLEYNSNISSLKSDTANEIKNLRNKAWILKQDNSVWDIYFQEHLSSEQLEMRI